MTESKASVKQAHGVWELDVSYSLNSLKEGYLGDFTGELHMAYSG